MSIEEPALTLPEPENETPRSGRTQRAIATVGLPPLEGTEEEVAQADEIRAAVLVEADDVLTELRTNELLTEAQADTALVAPQQVTDARVHQAQVALNRLRHQAEAAWWIAHGPEGARQLLNDIVADLETQQTPQIGPQ